MNPRQQSTFKLALANGEGFKVSGTHDTAPAPHRETLRAAVESQRTRWLTKILSRPGGFDGHRAVLSSWALTDGHLSLNTAYRSYTEGRALHDVLLQARADGTAELDPDLRNVDVTMSWGLVLACFVLLPEGYLLCGQRSQNLAVHPGEWTCVQTEIVEPEDICPSGMGGLLSRLVEEEMPSLKGVGEHQFVALGRWEDTGGWALASMLDLRAVPNVQQHLQLLKPDAETQAWGVFAMETQTHGTHKFGLPVLQSPPLHLALPRALKEAGVFTG